MLPSKFVSNVVTYGRYHVFSVSRKQCLGFMESQFPVPCLDLLVWLTSKSISSQRKFDSLSSFSSVSSYSILLTEIQICSHRNVPP